MSLGRVLFAVFGAGLLALFVLVWGAAFILGLGCDDATVCGDENRGYFVVSVLVVPALPVGLGMLYAALPSRALGPGWLRRVVVLALRIGSGLALLLGGLFLLTGLFSVDDDVVFAALTGFASVFLLAAWLAGRALVKRVHPRP